MSDKAVMCKVFSATWLNTVLTPPPELFPKCLVTDYPLNDKESINTLP